MQLAAEGFFLGVRSCLYVKSDSLRICTETFFIFQEILRAMSDFSASLHSIVDLWLCHTLTGVGSRRTISTFADTPFTSLQM
jgi:hypothetical protein